MIKLAVAFKRAVAEIGFLRAVASISFGDFLIFRFFFDEASTSDSLAQVIANQNTF